jgi:hypothetical protein
MGCTGVSEPVSGASGMKAGSGGHKADILVPD